MKRIIRISTLITLVGLTALIASAAALYEFSVTFSPSSSEAGATQTYTLTATNADESHKLKSVLIAIPSGFSVSSASVSPSDWNTSLTSNPGFIALQNKNGMLGGESFSLSFEATAPTSEQASVWTITAYSGEMFLGTGEEHQFQLTSAQPSVTIVPSGNDDGATTATTTDSSNENDNNNNTNTGTTTESGVNEDNNGSNGGPELVSISITSPATKLTYDIGDVLDISGLVVVGTYTDNSTSTLPITTSDVTGFDSSTPTIGQVLTVTYEGKTTTYTINVEQADVYLAPVVVEQNNGGAGGTNGVPGCKDPTATNYDPIAVYAGACIYAGGGGGQILGAAITGSPSSGEVLGASSSSLPLSCGEYLTLEKGLTKKALRQGSKNNPNLVTLLQRFLNEYIDVRIPVTGFFGSLTTNAVKKLQESYKENILAPWKLEKPTGIAYVTTVAQINNMKCPSLNIHVSEEELVPALE